MLVSLAEVAKTTNLIGTRLGQETYQRLYKLIEDNPAERFFQFSAKNVQVTDATFARETLLQLASVHRGHKGIMLVDIDDRDQLDNWSYAADNKGQPLMAWNGKKSEVLGDQTTRSGGEILKLVFKHGSVTTSKIADALNISVQNASTQMNRLQTQGYLVRTERVAATGGMEYVYHAISPRS